MSTLMDAKPYHALIRSAPSLSLKKVAAVSNRTTVLAVTVSRADTGLVLYHRLIQNDLKDIKNHISAAVYKPRRSCPKRHLRCCRPHCRREDAWHEWEPYVCGYGQRRHRRGCLSSSRSDRTVRFSGTGSEG